MNETYGITLELFLNKFKEKIQGVNNYFKTLKDKSIALDVDGAKLDLIEHEIEQISILLEENARKPFMDQEELLKTRAKLEQLNEEYDRLIEKEEKANREGKSAFNGLGKGIDKTMSKIKRFALSLFSIRSIYALVSRASSAYLSQDTALAEKLQASWIGLGAMLEPIISSIANMMIKAVKYVNIFIKALTGVDLLAKAMKKSLSGANKSAKALNKTLAGFDELNNLDTTTDAGKVDTGALSAFEDVEINTDWADKIRGFGEWLRENWKAIAIGVGVVAGAFLIFKLIPSKNIQEVGTSFTGLLNGIGKAVQAIALLGGIALVISQVTNLITAFSESGLSLNDVAILLGTVLGELAIAFTIVAAATKLMDWKGIAGATVILAGFALIINQVSNLLEVFSKTGMTVGDVALLMTTIFGTLIVLMGSIALLGPAMTAGLLPFAVVVAGISALLIVMAETIPIILEACSKFITNTAPSIKSILETIGNLITNIIYALGTTLPPIINSVGNLFGKIFDGISKVISTVGSTIVNILNTAKSLVTTVLSAILSFINNLGPAINKFVSNTISAVTKLINFLISGIEYLVNTLVIGGVNKIIKAINSISQYVGISIPTVSKMSIPRFVPKLNVGTNYVPEDQLAYIHKGEAVIPKKFNSQEYFGGNNEETNNLLQSVIEAIERIEINPYTTVRDVGQASESYFRDKERRTGREVFA